MIMDHIKEALTFDDVTLAPKYSEILPSEVDTSISISSNFKLKIPILSSAMDTVTESKMAITIAKAGGLGVIHRNLDIKKQILEIRKVKSKKLLVGAAVGAGVDEIVRAEAILKEGVDLNRVCIGHSNDTTNIDYLKGLMDKGAWLGLDHFPGTNPDWDTRTLIIKELIDSGYGERIMLSHDFNLGKHNANLNDQVRRWERNPDGYLFIKHMSN